MPYNNKHICKICNKEYAANQHNSICCYECKNKRKLINKKYICIKCKTEFVSLTSTHKKYCKECRKNFKREIKNEKWNLWYRKNKGYEPVCEVECIICKNKFLRKSIDEKCCSEECKYINRKRKGKEKYILNSKAIIEKRRNNIEEMIKLKLRVRVRCAVKSQGAHKSKKTMDLVGCTVKELKIHLENQFKPGMSWNNYNRYGWHIDHRIPCWIFNLKKEEHQKICFNYKNLQPMWAKENLSKQGKIYYDVC